MKKSWLYNLAGTVLLAVLFLTVNYTVGISGREGSLFCWLVIGVTVLLLLSGAIAGLARLRRQGFRYFLPEAGAMLVSAVFLLYLWNYTVLSC